MCYQIYTLGADSYIFVAYLLTVLYLSRRG
jgi:hypothetical protein